MRTNKMTCAQQVWKRTMDSGRLRYCRADSENWSVLVGTKADLQSGNYSDSVGLVPKSICVSLGAQSFLFDFSIDDLFVDFLSLFISFYILGDDTSIS